MTGVVGTDPSPRPGAAGASAGPSARRGRRWLRRGLLALAGLLGLALLVAVAAGLWLRAELRASLPALDGELALPGLREPVTIERDARGVPTIRAASALDLVAATGFLHAQDRFFQMDLLRRSAAGELAALVGPVALELDRARRVHRFRARARAMLAGASAATRETLEAYARGVNAGLGALGARPFEYLALRIEPEPWRPEDSTLVVLAMFFDLQDENGRFESALGVMHDVLPLPLFEFLTPTGTEWDAPVVGEAYRTPAVPGPEAVDLRTMALWADLRTQERARGPREPAAEIFPGSNNWAVAGAHTVHGAGLLANDMHLGLVLPNIWYRASLRWRDGADERRVAGVTLPGGPGIVAGSSTSVAWGFTNSYGDWSDLVVVETDPADEGRYRTPDGLRELELHDEVLRINTCAGRLACDGVQDGESLEVRETIWGPIVDTDAAGRPRAVRWVAHEPRAVNLGLLALAAARDVDEAIRLAHRAGIPAQNFVVADATGRIGWTIMGAVPRRTAYDSRLPGSWADGSRRWDGWLESEEYPRIVDPPGGRVWTANARVGDREVWERIGDGGYALGARARQIRDGLLPLDRASEGDMLALQLDDRALFLERWRGLLLDVLSPAALAGHARRAELRRLVEETWTGRASIDSVAFRMVRGFRLFTAEHVFGALTAPCEAVDPDFAYRHRQWEGPLWRLVTERPPHFLHPEFESWDAWLLSVVDYLLDYFSEDEGVPLAERTWGARNHTRIGHHLGAAAPFLRRWLDAPRRPLPGDSYMPRVQGIASGASQRMVVSPGREAEGIFHMPGGQSGHPLSPHYLDGHDDWAEGRATPFLPGPTVHTLTLTPG